MEKSQVDRINELARKKKTDGLTDEEHAEHETLRRQYLDEFKANVRHALDNTYIQMPDGSQKKLEKKPDAKE